MFYQMLTECRVKCSKGTALIIFHILKVKEKKGRWGKRERNKETDQRQERAGERFQSLL